MNTPELSKVIEYTKHFEDSLSYLLPRERNEAKQRVEAFLKDLSVGQYKDKKYYRLTNSEGEVYAIKYAPRRIAMRIIVEVLSDKIKVKDIINYKFSQEIKHQTQKKVQLIKRQTSKKVQLINE